ncbi:hypothetical protein BaRGS_00026013, partial [Batillaria attramentaria]
SGDDGRGDAQSVDDGRGDAQSVDDGRGDAQSVDDGRGDAQSVDDGRGDAQSVDDGRGDAQSGDDGRGDAQSVDDGRDDAQSGDDGRGDAQSVDDGRGDAQSVDDGRGDAQSVNDARGDESERKRAESFGWRALPPTTFSCKGKLPILRDLYQVAMAEYPDTQLFGFANGDLLFGAGLYETMKVISRDPMTREEPLLVVARRLNVNFANRSDVHRLDEVPEILRHASEFQDGSSDAFFTNRLFPWHRIPDIVPGKLGVAMFLVSTARTLNIKVIDISPSVNVIHMVSSFGLPESARSENSYCNRFLIQKLGMTPSHWSCGSIFCSSMTTETNYGAVRVVKKTTTLPPNCNNCTQNLTYFQTQHTPDV